MKKKGYIGWIVSKLDAEGGRVFVFNTLSERRSDSIQDYLDEEGSTWEGHRRDKDIQARVHKVTEIKVAG